jgi:hypothetical protein
MTFGFGVCVALQKLIDCSLFDKQRVAIYGDLLHQKKLLKGRGLFVFIFDKEKDPALFWRGVWFLWGRFPGVLN